MSKQEYAWLVALSALAARGESINDDDDQENPGPSIQSVYAKAGTFLNAPASSANDLSAVLLFILAWNSAKYRAQFSGNTVVSCKLTVRLFLDMIPLYPAWLRLFPDSIAPLGLCHIPRSLTERFCGISSKGRPFSIAVSKLRCVCSDLASCFVRGASAVRRLRIARGACGDRLPQSILLERVMRKA